MGSARRTLPALTHRRRLPHRGGAVRLFCEAAVPDC